jgi:hypothetical protein
MVTWDEFADAAPELAAKGRARFDATGLSLIGTLRRDGSPRISAAEPFIFEGQLALGMMWRSMKALDLRRDDRCVVHSTVTNKDGTEGEFKVYGQAREIRPEHHAGQRATRDRYCVALLEATGWAPEGEQWHLWFVDISQVSWFRATGDGTTYETDVWRPPA